jgi:hypothetical protein
MYIHTELGSNDVTYGGLNARKFGEGKLLQLIVPK